MLQRTLGQLGPTVSALGLGCMGMSEFYGAGDDAVSMRTIERALELGVTMLDTADMYGHGANERLVGKAIASKRDRVFLATKFGVVRDANDPTKRGISGRPDYVKRACDASLQRLGVDCIDLYYQHRVDPATQIEETVGAMKSLVDAGKVRYLGLSEASAQTIERAVRIHPIAALQTEWSLWSRDIEENGQLAAARRYGIGIVAYSPLGRGFLSGQIRSIDDLADDDFRRSNPRFMGENFEKNIALVRRVEAIAQRKGCTPSQLALAWLLARGDDVVPIPGTKHVERLEENVAAVDVTLDARDLEEIESVFPVNVAHGDRYADMSSVGR